MEFQVHRDDDEVAFCESSKALLSLQGLHAFRQKQMKFTLALLQ